MKKTWEKISGKQVYSCSFFNVMEDKVVRPDGRLSSYCYIKPRTGVMVVPFDGKYVYLVRQFRYTAGKTLWEFPAGGAENKNFLAQAKKELKEETGIIARKWTFLGEFVPAPSSSSGIGKLFVAQGLSFGKSQLEPSERDMIVKKFTLAEINKMVLAGEIVSGWTLASLLFFQLRLKKLL